MIWLKLKLLFVLMLCISCNNNTGQHNHQLKDSAGGPAAKGNNIAGN
jgi:hypothetical protein